MGIFDGAMDALGLGAGDVPQFDSQAAIDQQVKYNRHGVDNVFGSSGWEDGNAYQNLSPALQNLFSQQFDPSAYQGYAQNYYDNQSGIMADSFANQEERLRSRMANRGLPVGGEAFDDEMGNFMTGERNAYANLASQADQMANQRMMQDYQRLMGAMGQIPVSGSQIDVMGPQQLQHQSQVAQVQADNQAIGNLWNLAGTVGAGYMMGPAAAGVDFFGNPT